jgi:MFS transporter, OFA family, oxalate/formate antiporter
VEPRLMLVATQSSCALMLLVAVLSAPGIRMSVLMLAVVGVCYGCLPSLYPVLVARTYGAARAPEVYGRLFTAWGAAGVAAPLLAGLLFDWRRDYSGALVVAALVAAVAALASLALARLDRPPG